MLRRTPSTTNCAPPLHLVDIRPVASLDDRLVPRSKRFSQIAKGKGKAAKTASEREAEIAAAAETLFD